jgi:hypothetical protein
MVWWLKAANGREAVDTFLLACKGSQYCPDGIAQVSRQCRLNIEAPATLTSPAEWAALSTPHHHQHDQLSETRPSATRHQSLDHQTSFRLIRNILATAILCGFSVCGRLCPPKVSRLLEQCLNGEGTVSSNSVVDTCLSSLMHKLSYHSLCFRWMETCRMAALSVKVFLAVNLPTEVVKVAPSSFSPTFVHGRQEQHWSRKRSLYPWTTPSHLINPSLIPSPPASPPLLSLTFFPSTDRESFSEA